MKLMNNYAGKTEYLPKSNINFKANYVDIKLFSQLNQLDDDRKALLFIKRQGDIVNPVDANGNHVIHVITKKGFYETLKQMLINPKRAKELLSQRGEDGKTPLAMSPSEKISKLMISKGANMFSLDNNMRPAGLDAAVPEEVSKRVEEKFSTFEQRNIETPKAEELVSKTAGAEYSKTQQSVETQKISEPPASVQEPSSVGEKPQKSFFNMFVPKQKTEVQPQSQPQTQTQTQTPTPTQTPTEPQTQLQPEPAITEEPKSEVIEETIEPTVEQATEAEKSKKPLSEIKIKGTEAFRRIDTPEVPDMGSIVGLDKIKTALKTSIIEPVTNEKISNGLTQNKISIPNGLLLVAPPGNGKTALVKALGAEAGMPVFEATNVTEAGQIVEAVSKGFEQNKQRAVIYMRGLDNLYAQGTNGELTNQLLSLMSETSKCGSLLVFSAECPENIPKAVLTPGKIDRILSFKSPDYDARLAYLISYIEDKEILKNINPELIANKTQGFSIAQIKHVVNEAVLSALSSESGVVTTDDLEERIKVFSKEQNIPEINEYNKTSMYDTFIRRYQPTEYDAKDFESIAGMRATKSSVEEGILKPWKNADKLRKEKIQLPAGGVFAGDPGTSKTYMAKAIARSLKIPLYLLKMSDIGSSYVHETSQNIGKIVNQLITKFDETGEASVLLMDEIDHFQKGQSQSGAEEVNTLLQEVERGRNKILFIGTTNELECLPDSLVRDGRMGTVIHFEHCDKDAAKVIIQNLLKDRAGNEKVSALLKNDELLESLAKRCSGMVAASVSAIVNDALSDCIINETPIETAFDKAVSLRKKKDIEKMLSKTSKDAGHRLNISEDTTIMYDTKYPRMVMSETDPKKLDDLGGMQEVKNVLRNEIVDIYNPETLQLLRENRLPITKGFILHGPPGNGKTTIVKAIANEMQIPLYPLNTGNIGSSYIHQLARNAQEVRDQLAYKYKMTGERSMLFMDEAQQLVPKTSGSLMAHSHNVEETNFFKDMIMTAEQDGIIYAMATNDLDQIEPAFYENADRLGVCAYVGNPDLESRLGIIKKLLDDRPITKLLNTPENIQVLAEMFEGLSISKISQSILNIVRNSIKTRTPVTLEKAVELIRNVK